LPQVKLAWIVASGPASDLGPALDRLDVVSDTYLSVSTPVQVAAGALLDAGRPIRRAIQARLRRNLDRLRAEAGRCPAVTLLEPEGGWSAVIRVPATAPEESIVIDALTGADVLVQPGFFFDFPYEAYLAIGLLPEPHVFDEGVSRLVARVGGAAA
jgi:DNA-binding transcriptional MocR family regulator